MKKILTSLSLLSLLAFNASAQSKSYFKTIPTQDAPSKSIMVFQPKAYVVYKLNEGTLKNALFNVGTSSDEAITIALPLPNGQERLFKVWDCPMMPDELAAKYPEIRTFSAVAVDNPTVTAKLDFTWYGFHAMIFDGEHTSFIDPYDNYRDGYYFSHYKADEVRTFDQKMTCEVHSTPSATKDEAMSLQPHIDPKTAARTGNGWQLRTYRLAVSASNQYSAAATGLTAPTIAQVFAKITTSINRINGVYEREFAVHLNFVAKEDTVIWNVRTGGPNGTDPFNGINSNGTACLGANQTQCTNRIGTANYDLGHVFTTGGGGISGLGIVCISNQKARSVTGSPTPVGDGYDIDYVAHEMGHEFGSEHTFNNNADGSCSGNAVSNYAYETGSGSSIMAYAGICSPDNPAMHSEAYFHASSLVQIYGKLTTTEDVCAVKTATGNKLPYIAPFSANYKIPYKTPFELTSPTAVDSVADTANLYCWEQWNLGDFGKRITATYLRGPIFRTFYPVYTPTRIFPKLSMVLAGGLSNAGIDGAQGEKAPDTTRFLTFKMTARAILNGLGAFNFPDDTIHLDAISTGAANGFAGFTVTSQNTTGISYMGGSTQTITWNKVGTDAAPVSCANVTIYLSLNGGTTFPYALGTFPNTGTANVPILNPTTTTTRARFKVKGTGNVFFNVNKQNFTLTNNPSLPSGINEATAALEATIYPVPANTSLHIATNETGNYEVAVFNTLGQKVHQESTNGTLEIPTATWSNGIYLIQITNKQTGSQIVKRATIQQ